jgi:hypothetical protein
MPKRDAVLVFLCTAIVPWSVTARADLSAQTRAGDLTVHEWGTFTTVAGEDGRAVGWLPLSGPVDLPCFVYHYQNDPLIKLGAGTRRLDYDDARAHLRGRVRMETPVLYFYSSGDVTLNVRVEFPRGLITEWYPQATVTQAVVTPDVLRDPGAPSAIEWRGVEITAAPPRPLPTDMSSSHYYAARTAGASAVTVQRQTEKFLFYRGVADFDVPIAVEALGASVRITNPGPEELRGVILFENRGGRIGYRMLGAVRGVRTSEWPTLDASLTDLRRELAGMLVDAGLHPQEAAAMVETWRDSWFEEGARVFYLVPPRAIDAILPLTIAPAPAAITRVFVGRMDVVTTPALRAVAGAIMTGDTLVLERWGRLLGPIVDRILANSTNGADADRARAVRDAAFARHLRSVRICD